MTNASKLKESEVLTDKIMDTQREVYVKLGDYKAVLTIQHIDYVVTEYRESLPVVAPIENELQQKFEWLVRHSIETASISKARGAELLGIPLIDMDEFLKRDFR